MDHIRLFCSVCTFVTCIYLVKAGGKKETSEPGMTPTSSCSGKREKYLAAYSPTDPEDKVHCDYYKCGKKNKYVKQTCPENQAVSKVALERAAETKAQSAHPCVDQTGACLASGAETKENSSMPDYKKECNPRREKYLAEYSPTDPKEKVYCDFYECQKKKFVKQTCPENQAVSKSAIKKAMAGTAQKEYPCVEQQGACLTSESETKENASMPDYNRACKRREKYLAEYSPSDPKDKEYCDFYECQSKKYVKQTCPENQTVSETAIKRAMAGEAQNEYPCVYQHGACLESEARGRAGILLPIDGGDSLNYGPGIGGTSDCDVEVIWVMPDVCPIGITSKANVIKSVRAITENQDFVSSQNTMDPFWACLLTTQRTSTALLNKYESEGFQYFYSYGQKEEFPDVLFVVTDDVQFQGSSDLTGRGVIAYAVAFPKDVYNKYDNVQLSEWASKAGTSDIFPVDTLKQLDDIIWKLGEISVLSMPV